MPKYLNNVHCILHAAHYHDITLHKEGSSEVFPLHAVKDQPGPDKSPRETPMKDKLILCIKTSPFYM